MSTERRKTRRTLVVNLDLYNQESQEFIGKVINLSEGGLLVITDEELEEDKSLNVRFIFYLANEEQINLDFTVRIVWSDHSAHDPSKYSTGMEFSENPELQVQFIQQMIKLFKQK